MGYKWTVQILIYVTNESRQRILVNISLTINFKQTLSVRDKSILKSSNCRYTEIKMIINTELISTEMLSNVL
jgi:hypothetical protein